MAEVPLQDVLGVLRGAVEGDTTKYFGSVWRLRAYTAEAVRLGLVEASPEGASGSEYVPTALGREIHDQYRVGELTPARTYHWHGPLLESAVAALQNIDIAGGNS